MAGSYGHVVDDSGRLLRREKIVEMLENDGDVVEAVMEMYGMIWWLAARLAESMGSEEGSSRHDVWYAEGRVEAARKRWRDGLDSASPGYLS